MKVMLRDWSTMPFYDTQRPYQLVACPYCRAPKGVPCCTHRGKVADVHAARLYAVPASVYKTVAVRAGRNKKLSKMTARIRREVLAKAME
jgi:hypothetical protein